MRERVSMVVPCYNKAPYIGAMLQSVCNQDWDDIELILVNDGSTDGTRGEIARWEPRLRARGYTVIVIDQENAGVCRATLAGMQQAHGELFCTIDADDEVEPDYVSEMAEFLLRNPEYDWVSCGYALYRKDGETIVREPGLMHPDLPTVAHRLESYLLYRRLAALWCTMVRTAYLKRCGVAQNYEDAPRDASHEPGFNIPLSWGNGKVGYISKSLYHFNTFASEMSRAETLEDRLGYFQRYQREQEKAILNLSATGEEKGRLLHLCNTANLMNVLQIYGAYGKAEQAAHVRHELLLALEAFRVKLHFTEAWIKRVGDWVFTTTVQYLLLGRKAPCVTGRVIGYGALGQQGQLFLPLLEEAGYRPDILWDSGAGEGSSWHGVPVEAPEPDLLRKEDSVLVFPLNRFAVAEIETTLKNVGCVVLSTFDIADLVAAHYVRQMQDKGEAGHAL